MWSVLTSQTLDIQKRKHGLLQSNGNKTALNQSLSTAIKMERNTCYWGFEEECNLDRKTAGESSSKEGGQCFDETCGVGLDITQWDSL